MLENLLNVNSYGHFKTLESIQEIIKCAECNSNKNLCYIHAELIKTYIVNDVKSWLDELNYHNNKTIMKNTI